MSARAKSAQIFYRRLPVLLRSGIVDGMEQPENGEPANDAEISDLFRKIEQGEKNALFNLYDRTGGLLFGLILKILGNPADAEETLLNIYTRIWEKPVSYNIEYPPLAFLVIIARAHALTRLYEIRRSYVPAHASAFTDERRVKYDRRRRSSRHTHARTFAFERRRAKYDRRQRTYMSPHVTTADSGKNINTSREQKDARARFESLASKQREVLDWAFCSGLSAEEIAARTGMPVGAVKTHVRIGLNRLGKDTDFPNTNHAPDNLLKTPADENEGYLR